MRSIIALASLGLALLPAGCVVQSIQPFAVPKDRSAAPKEVLGKWYVHHLMSRHTLDDDLPHWEKIDAWTIWRDHATVYWVDWEKPLVFDVLFFKVEGDLLCDAKYRIPSAPGKLSEAVAHHVLPVHTLWKVDYGDGTLTLIPFGDSVLLDRVKKGETNLPHIQVMDIGQAGSVTTFDDDGRETSHHITCLPDKLKKGPSVFSASPDDWMSYLKKYSRDKTLFREQTPVAVLKRVPYDWKEAHERLHGD